MSRAKIQCLCMVLCLVGYLNPLRAQQAIPKTGLHVGQLAPDFVLLSDKWERVKLSDFRGKKNVVLVFYVLAFSPT